jgi:hypothetical protein
LTAAPSSAAREKLAASYAEIAAQGERIPHDQGRSALDSCQHGQARTELAAARADVEKIENAKQVAGKFENTEQSTGT